jgi:predicted RNA-binding Zn-ribbon protein involved in translation (DUF1610 family)
MGIERLVFAPPTEQYIEVERRPVEAKCPACGGVNIARYPIANYIGPRMVTKCQDCFEVLALDRPAPADNWPPFRPAAMDWKASRAG